MSLAPSTRAQARCVHLLQHLIDSPPEGFAGLKVEQVRKGSGIEVGFIDADDLDGDAEDLFLDHVEQHAAAGGSLRYRIQTRGSDGRLVNGATASWGLRRTNTDAAGAKTAGGGSELAAAALSRTQGEAFGGMMEMVRELAPQAAARNADHVQLILDLQADRQEESHTMMVEMMRLQTALVESKMQNAINDRSGLLEGPAGEVLVAALPGIAVKLMDVLGEFMASRTARNRLETEALRRDLGLPEPDRTIPAPATAPATEQDPSVDATEHPPSLD